MVAGRSTENKAQKCYKFNFNRKRAGRALKLHRRAKRSERRRGRGQEWSRAREGGREGGRERAKREAPANLGSASACAIRGGF